MTTTTKKKKKKAAPKKNAQPFVEIKGSSVDPVHGLKIELDWNDAFIQYLRQNGFTGSNDEAIVQKWLGHLYGQIVITDRSQFE